MKRKNIRGLLDVMEQLRGRVDPADAVLMEQLIREAEQPANRPAPTSLTHDCSVITKDAAFNLVPGPTVESW